MTGNANFFSVYGYARNDIAGYFYTNGNVGLQVARGNLVINTGYRIKYDNGAEYKAFTIDHPLDPANQVLRHFSAEGPEALVIYSGKSTLDSNGQAVIELPAYFAELSRSPRVHLTPIGRAVPLALKEEFTGDNFTAIGPVGVSFYWQVTAERDDPKARLERQSRPVEEMKGRAGLPPKGSYISPEVYPQARKMVDD
jgi:hypothetical protein